MKRIIFWLCFVVVLGLIIWGLVVAMNKSSKMAEGGTPAPVTSEDNVRGGGATTLIEYADFQCPACGAYYPLVERLYGESSSSVTMVYRHFPLGQHKNAVLAAKVAEAASKQGKFWDMYRLLFENQESWSELPDQRAREIFAQYALRIGLNKDVFGKDIDAPDIAAKIDAERQEGISIGVNGTPTFFLNGKRLATPPSYDEFKKLIKNAIASSTT